MIYSYLRSKYLINCTYYLGRVVIRNWPKKEHFNLLGTQGRGTNIRIEINHTRLEIAGNYKLPVYKINQK
jgi:hypothetical protein